MSPTCATWSMPMNASTSGMSFGSSSRNRCGRQPETITAWPRRFASRNSTDSRIVSTLSSCAESMKEQVLTMTRVGLRGVVGDFHAAFDQRAEHDFGVHEIFGAAEGNQADAQRRFTGIFLRHRRKRLAGFWREAILRIGFAWPARNTVDSNGGALVFKIPSNNDEKAPSAPLATPVAWPTALSKGITGSACGIVLVISMPPIFTRISKAPRRPVSHQ